MIIPLPENTQRFLLTIVVTIAGTLLRSIWGIAKDRRFNPNHRFRPGLIIMDMIVAVPMGVGSFFIFPDNLAAAFLLGFVGPDQFSSWARVKLGIENLEQLGKQ